MTKITNLALRCNGSDPLRVHAPQKQLDHQYIDIELNIRLTFTLMKVINTHEYNV